MDEMNKQDIVGYSHTVPHSYFTSTMTTGGRNTDKMGEIDINIKNFIKINSVFAQLFEKGAYNGRLHIEPDRLYELNSSEQEVLKLTDGRLAGLERFRDSQKVAMLFDDKVTFQVIMGIEEQTGVHYYMPVRCMEMDALSYVAQCRNIAQRAREQKKLKKYADGVPKGTKIIPVVTLVLYVGSRPWDGPNSIYDMFDIPDRMKDYLKQTVPDYKMNLIDARHMTPEEIDKFDGDLKAFLLMLQEKYDREKLKTAVAIHRETWYAISSIKNDKRYREYIDSISEEELLGGVNMDMTLDYIEAQGEKRGRQEGRLEGRREGRLEGRQEGRLEAMKLISRLYPLLVADNRLGDWNAAMDDRDILIKLLKEYALYEE